MDYYCDIPKRVVETTNRAIRSKVFQIPCRVGRRRHPAGAEVWIWSTGSATATNGSSGNWDYNFYHSYLKMYPGDRGTQRLGFRINDDQGVEKAETFSFALKWSTKVGYPPFWFTVNESLHTFTVHIDDDDEFHLSVSPDNISESGGGQWVTVTATNTSGAKLSEDRWLNIQVGNSNDHAVEGTDYQSTNDFRLRIPKGKSSAQTRLLLTPIDDAHLEAGERITLSGSGSSQINGRTLTPRVRGTGLWITDSETITLSATPDVNEGGGAQTVTVTATASGTAQRAIPLTISVGKSGDAAVSGTDYHAVSDFTLTIPSGSSSGTATFQLTPINDTTLENDETVSISGRANYGGTITDASVKILDNDVQLSLNPSSTGEEAGAKTITVTAKVKTARSTAQTVTVSVGKPGDQATEGTDYGAVADFSVSIAANATSGTATFTFAPRDDKIIEGTEHATVYGTATGLDVNSVGLAMTETDRTDLRLSTNPSKVPEDGTTRSVSVTLSTTDGYTFSGDVTCFVGTGNGSAGNQTDYDLFYKHGGQTQRVNPNGPGQGIKIKANQTSGSNGNFTLRPVSDSTVEGDETVKFVKGTQGCYNQAYGKSIYAADLTIVDDEAAISLSASPSSVAENAGATSVKVTASMPTGQNATFATKVTVTIGKSGDSATSGTDYKAIETFAITIPKSSNSASKTITFTPIDDALVEDDETITISGTTPKNSVSGTTLTIDDDDTGAITLTAKPSSVGEGAGATTVTVTASTGGVTFQAAKTVTVSVGKSGDTATKGTDYKAVPDFTLTIDSGKSSGTGTFTLTPVDDTTLESDESISVSGTATDLTVTGTSVTIEDDDDEITLSASPSSVAESAGATTVTVTATKASGTVSADTAVTVSVGETGDEATSAIDYKAVADFTLTIDSGKSSGTATFTLTPVDDTLYEGDEKLSIGGSATGYRVGKTSVKITDDDDSEKVTATISVKPKRVKECSGATTIAVTAELPDDVYTLPEDRKITLSVGKSTDGATSGTDYTAVDDFTLTIKAGQHTGLATFTLTPTDDTAQEGDETLTVHGTAKRLAVGNDAEVTIEDDDQPVVVLTMDPAKIPEQESTKSTTVTVTASLWTGTDRCASSGSSSSAVMRHERRVDGGDRRRHGGSERGAGRRGGARAGGARRLGEQRHDGGRRGRRHRRHRGFRHGLHRGDRLQHHHQERPDQGHGHVHHDGEPRQFPGADGDLDRQGQRDGDHGVARQRAGRGQGRALFNPDGESDESLGRRRRHRP